MNLPELIETYGYWAVLGGTLLEGESVLLLAGFAAHRGYLDLPIVVGVAIARQLPRRPGLLLLGRTGREAARALTRATARRPRLPRRSSPGTTRR